VTGCHRGLKQKLRVSYRVPSLQRMGWLQSDVTKMDTMSRYRVPSLQRMGWLPSDVTKMDTMSQAPSPTHVTFFIVDCGIMRFL